MAKSLTELRSLAVAPRPAPGQGLSLDPNGKIPRTAFPVYTAYTPTWTASSGTATAIGDAVVAARYAQIGKMVHAYGNVTFGAGSTFGTAGFFKFALPVTAALAPGLGQAVGSAFLYDSSAGNFHQAIPFPATTTTLAFLYAATYGGVQTLVGLSAPWTWATGDQIVWNITYEAA